MSDTDSNSTTAAGICPVGSTQERYPGFDVLPGTNVGSAVVASEDACVQLCEDAPQCLSAVFVTNSLACYLKAGSLKLRESGFADRFVVVGCAGETRMRNISCVLKCTWPCQLVSARVGHASL